MSQSEVERFVSDLKSNDDLRAELSEHASGVGSVVEFAKGKGYDISAAEATAYIQDQSNRELNDDELDAVAGGKSESAVTTSIVVGPMTSTTAQDVSMVIDAIANQAAVVVSGN